MRQLTLCGLAPPPVPALTSPYLGSFNSGFNVRACTRCQGGLTTPGSGGNSSADCQAPAGSYSLRGSAVPCAQGTYKAAIGNRDCDKCPEGWTTQPRTVGATSALACACAFFGGGVRASNMNADSLRLVGRPLQHTSDAHSPPDPAPAHRPSCSGVVNSILTLPLPPLPQSTCASARQSCCPATARRPTSHLSTATPLRQSAQLTPSATVPCPTPALQSPARRAQPARAHTKMQPGPPALTRVLRRQAGAGSAAHKPPRLALSDRWASACVGHRPSTPRPLQCSSKQASASARCD